MWNNQGVIYVEIVLNVSLKCVYCFRSKQILRLNEFISIHKNKIWFYGTAKSSAAVATFVDMCFGNFHGRRFSVTIITILVRIINTMLIFIVIITII